VICRSAPSAANKVEVLHGAEKNRIRSPVINEQVILGWDEEGGSYENGNNRDVWHPYPIICDR
jgi:hypothetical protein